MKYIAVLLTVHNRKDKTIQCLKYLFEQEISKGYQIDLFLTDDGCTDGTPEAVHENFPGVYIVEGDGTLYWNRGMYMSWNEATKTKEYDYFLWLNDDTILESGSLQILLSTSTGLNDNAIVVGTTRASDTDTATYGGRTSIGRLIIPRELSVSCEYFNGNIVLIPKEVYKIVGMNDPVFHHSLGDFDYGLRAKNLGVKIYVAPGILGVCDAHDTLPTWCNPKKTLQQRWKAFRSPLGQNPEEFFVFERRHNGLAMAIFHYATNHLRMLCPWIWNLK
ncbi:glycosyltransferase family 2 protein [Sphingobacterium sp. DN00404]|uniref:Glycosyltransferase family 2 protein n=1 Tax=Sphingobacterium micropteri TaxID=2763501 RepID=A0ABR7YKI7_9SPHI|nr:glycosyltransferase family 2 protein [Sphingobacterium micropteri]MBD1431746.1 glycosyltransferase family 2 protein [Sphingobacterium micropteri]